MTTKDERRVAVLGLLDLHAQVRWHEPGGANAFADAVLELAGRLGRVDEVPAMRPVRVATDAERQAAMMRIRRVFASGTGSPLSDSEGQVSTRTPPDRPGASEGDL